MHDSQISGLSRKPLQRRNRLNANSGRTWFPGGPSLTQSGVVCSALDFDDQSADYAVHVELVRFDP